MTGTEQTKLFTWHEEPWKNCRPHLFTKFPQALLLAGQKGLGKSQFAEALSSRFFCQSDKTNEFACGECHDCQLLLNESHPDLFTIEPEEDSNTIKIDQIRQLSKFVWQTSHRTAGKIIIINPADALNKSSSNALLKLLEDCPKATHFILLSHATSLLLPTILSRCSIVRFPAPSIESVKSWLSTESSTKDDHDLAIFLAANAPLRALEILEGEDIPQYRKLVEDLSQVTEGKIDPIAAAGNWMKMSSENMLLWTNLWLISIIRVHSGLSANTLQGLSQNLSKQLTDKRLNLTEYYNFTEMLVDAQRKVNAKINLNLQLMLEKLFITGSKLLT